MRRARYKDAVSWIAMNDDPGEMDDEIVAMNISTKLVADLWDISDRRVARDVVLKRVSIERMRERTAWKEQVT